MNNVCDPQLLKKEQALPGPVHGKGLLRRAPLRRASSLQEAQPIVHEVLRSPGQPLDPTACLEMETRFSRDFSGVRIHTDAKAAESARAVSALAYTVGNDVVFGARQYSPRTEAGRSLLAHELVHVLQQEARPSSTGSVHIDPVDSLAEREARAVTAQVANPARGMGTRPDIRFRQAQPVVSRTPIFGPQCRGEYDRCQVVEPLRAANQLVDRAISELSPLASGAVTQGRIVDLLNVHFHNPSDVAGQAAVVLHNYRSIKVELNTTLGFNCHPAENECTSERGRVGAFTGDQSGGEIGLCEAYHNSPCEEQGRILVHEVCHHIPATRIDHAYVQDANYMSLPFNQATENPDTYAQFAKMALMGGPSCKECSAEVQLRPGQY